MLSSLVNIFTLFSLKDKALFENDIGAASVVCYGSVSTVLKETINELYKTLSYRERLRNF